MKQRIVIKLGGSALQNTETMQQLAVLIRGYQKRRYSVVVVHGGGPAINAELNKQKITWKFINGQRQTTLEMMKVIEQVLAVDVNSMLVENLNMLHIPAVGLSGANDKILSCTQTDKELQNVGTVQAVNPAAIELVLAQFRTRVPVIAPIGIGAMGERYNVNADWAATKIAIALGAKKLIFLTDQKGILDKKQQLVPKVSISMMDSMMDEGIIHGGMSTKVKAMICAVEAGIKYVRVMHASFAAELLSDITIGTLLTKKYTPSQPELEVLNGKAG